MRTVARGVLTLGMLGVLGSLGCTAFEETYYVGVLRKGSGQPLQFYKFDMRGHADWYTKTKYVSGWYPAEALQAVVGEYREVSDYPDSIDPEATLRRAAEQPLGTVWEPIELDFAGPAGPRTLGTAEVKTTRVRIANGGVLSGAALKKIKWEKLKVAISLTKRQDGKEDGTTVHDADVFRILVAGQMARALADADGVDAVFTREDQNRPQTIVIQRGTAVISGLQSVAARDVLVDAVLKSGEWEERGGTWIGGQLEQLTARERTYRWSMTGGAAEIIPKRAAGGRGTTSAQAEAHRVYVGKPTRLTLESGWRVTATNPEISPATNTNEQGSLHLKIEGQAGFSISRKDLKAWPPVSELSKETDELKKPGEALQQPVTLESGQALPGKAVLESNGKLSYTTVFASGTLRLTNLNREDFKIEFSRPSKRQFGTDPQGLEYWVIGPEGSRRVLTDQRLVIFMSSDPQPVISAIQNFAQSQDVQKSMATILKHYRAREGGGTSAGTRRAIVKAGLLGLKNLIEAKDDEAVNANFVENTVGEAIKKLLTAQAGG